MYNTDMSNPLESDTLKQVIGILDACGEGKLAYKLNTEFNIMKKRLKDIDDYNKKRYGWLNT